MTCIVSAAHTLAYFQATTHTRLEPHKLLDLLRMQVNLTLHGLWPQYNSKHDDHLWPQCCESQYGRDVDPSVVKVVSAPLAASQRL